MTVETGTFDLPDSLVKSFLAEPNSLEHLSPAEPLILPIKDVSYRGDVNRPGAPISMEIDRLGTAKLFKQELGFTPAEVAEVDLYVIGEGNMTQIEPDKKKRKKLFPYGSPKKGPLQKLLREEDTYAVSDLVKEKDDEGKEKNVAYVIIYLSVLWSDFNKDKDKILSYSKKRQKELAKPSAIPAATLEDKDLNLLNISKRMLRYLEIAPLDRISRFLDRLGEIRSRREILGDIVHEGVHLEEDRHEKKHPLLKKKGVIDVLYFLSRFSKRAHDYLEKRAEQAEERVTNKSPWYDIVYFAIDSPQSKTPTVGERLAA